MKKFISLTISLSLFYFAKSQQNVGIGTTTPASSAKLEISSNNKGFLPPRMTEAERNNILNPVDGLIIFNITTGTINFYFNGVWNEFTAVPLGAIGALNCAGATATGVLTEGVSGSGVSSRISYTGGNGRKHSGQTVGSTGVTGLTATLPAGNFANGSGNLVYTITGIPANSGTASFELNIGGKTCTLTRLVNIVGTISSLNCGGAINSGMLTQSIAASGVSSSVPYTGGNGGTYASQIVTSTGVTGLTATLPSGSFTNGVGNLIITITGTPSGSGSANFALNIGGQTCTLSRSVNTLGTISTINCAGATNTGTLTVGIAASGVSSVITYTGGNSGGHNGQIVTSTGVTGLTATLAPGIFADGIGIVTYNITGTPTSSGTASFALNIGGQTCTLTRTVSLPVGTITALACNTATNIGNLNAGIAASGVSSNVPYTGGNGGTHTGQTVTSTGVTGLTATLIAGSFANGAGNLVYTITGTPASSGAASFALNIGGQTCVLNYPVNPAIGDYPTGTVHCTSTPTAVLDVLNPATGKIWMDRNLGANRVAISINDEQAFGDLYQWGRRADGHQCRNSSTINTLSSVDQPTHGSFILAPNSPSDWRSPENLLLWQGVNGINNPCPNGYRLPTETELNAERLSWSNNNSIGAFSSPLKLHVAGRRDFSSGTLNNVETSGLYWSSTVSGTSSRNLFFHIGGADMVVNVRANGLSVRCIKEPPSLPGTIQTIACGTASNTGTLTAGVAANGVNSSIPYTGGNGGTHPGQTVTSTGVTGLTATLSAGSFVSGAGSLIYTITGIPASSGTASFVLNIGGQTCTLNRTVTLPVGTINALNCEAATNTGTLTRGIAANTVSSLVPYTGGNGGTHTGQTVTSTGVTGLTATLAAGTFANGAGNLTYIITGTPASSGAANFALNIGAQTCVLTYPVNPAIGDYPTGTVHCTPTPTVVVDVINPTTGRTWMDRNLGASRVATSSTDAEAYGDLYQWGRRADGHQCRNSATISTLSSTDQPGHGNFILAVDWRNPPNNNLWQGVNGVNNPCPNGYRIPTSTELIAERASWSLKNYEGAFASPLKLTLAGFRGSDITNSLSFVGGFGYYWISTVDTDNLVKFITFGGNNADIGSSSNRAAGRTVRCIKE